MRYSNVYINRSALICSLRTSKSLRSMRTAKMVHAFILRSALAFDLFMFNNLLHAYWLCGETNYAAHMFDQMPLRDVVSWNTMICGSVALGAPYKVFHYFHNLVQQGYRPTQSSFVSLLGAAIEMIQPLTLLQIQGLSFKYGFPSDTCVGNALLGAYSEYGYVDQLSSLSKDMSSLDEISYEIMSKAYTRHGMFEEAFGLFKQSYQEGVHFSNYALSSLISSCAASKSIQWGSQVHVCSIKVGLDMNNSVVNSLITMYARCDCVHDAKQLFEWSDKRDLVTWNALISGFANNGDGKMGIDLMGRLLVNGLQMNLSTLRCFLPCCAAISDLFNAKIAHVLILKLRDCFVQGSDNTILTMYCRCGSLEYAVIQFQAMQSRDIVSFNLMMGLYRSRGDYEMSVMLFSQLHVNGFTPDEMTLIGALSSCAKLGLYDLGNQIYGCIIKSGTGGVLDVKNAILEMYSHLGTSNEVDKIFEGIEEPDVFSCNMVIIGYTHFTLPDKISGFLERIYELGIEFNEFSYSILLDACSCFSWSLAAMQIHSCIIKRGLASDTTLMNSLLTAYADCRMIEQSLTIFEQISSPDSITWNAMISSCAQNGFAEKSIKFYREMNRYSMEMNEMTFASVCMSCAMLAELNLSFQIHAQVLKRSYESNMSVSNSLITMYCKCGDIESSSKIFTKLIHRDVITWNAMICAYAQHGLGQDALGMFSQMNASGVKPNNLTFVSLLSACSRAGLISEGFDVFNSISCPTEEHYACLIDILCRSNRLDEAKRLTEKMSSDNSSLVWKMLLSACKTNRDFKLGEKTAWRLMNMEATDSAAFILLSNMYCSLGMSEEKAKLRSIMVTNGVKKAVGCSWVQT